MSIMRDNSSLRLLQPNLTALCFVRLNLWPNPKLGDDYCTDSEIPNFGC